MVGVLRCEKHFLRCDLRLRVCFVFQDRINRKAAPLPSDDDRVMAVDYFMLFCDLFPVLGFTMWNGTHLFVFASEFDGDDIQGAGDVDGALADRSRRIDVLVEVDGGGVS